jgi:hypothetical protein
MPNTRENALIYIPMAMGSLSLIGSSLIILSICRSKQEKKRPNASLRASASQRSSLKGCTSHVYNRIMIAMSIYDIIFTFVSAMFGNLFKPHDTNTPGGGHGTTFTCSLQGFFSHWGYGCFAYGAWLSVYFVLTIRYNIQDVYLVRYFEPIVHSTVFIFYFGTAVIASTLGFMNPTIHSTCWIVPYPLICSESDSIPCDRGANYKQAGLWMVLLPSCISVMVILICLSLVGYTVWQQKRVLREQQMRLPSASPIALPALSSSSASPPRVALQGNISAINDSDPVSGNVIPPLQGERPTNAAWEEPRRTKSRGLETASSEFEERANDAIVQCIISSCTVANSVIWLSVIVGLGVTGRYSRHDRFWVRRGGRFIASRDIVLGVLTPCLE